MTDKEMKEIEEIVSLEEPPTMDFGTALLPWFLLAYLSIKLGPWWMFFAYFMAAWLINIVFNGLAKIAFNALKKIIK